jgi:hypothetical protein
VRTTEDQTVATGHSLDVDPARWQEGLEELLDATPGPLASLVRVAGRRWTIEERFQTGKGALRSISATADPSPLRDVVGTFHGGVAARRTRVRERCSARPRGQPDMGEFAVVATGRHCFT